MHTLRQAMSWRNMEGYCVQKAVLLVALARAAGIPARLRFAEIRSHLTAPEIVEKRGSNLFPITDSPTFASMAAG